MRNVSWSRDRVRALYWERYGSYLWMTRLEWERFKWPRTSNETALTLRGQQSNWLLDGYDIACPQPHKRLRFSSAL